MAGIRPRVRLRQYVREAGTQVRAAKRLGISQPHVSDLLRGRRTFTAALLAKLGLERDIRIVEASK